MVFSCGVPKLPAPAAVPSCRQSTTTGANFAYNLYIQERHLKSLHGLASYLLGVFPVRASVFAVGYFFNGSTAGDLSTGYIPIMPSRNTDSLYGF